MRGSFFFLTHTWYTLKLETLSETYSYNIAEKQKLLNTPEFKEGLTNI